VFNTLIAASASKILDQAIAEASEILNRAKVVGGQLDLTDIGLYKPGATWTYMVTDDHFGSWWERLGKFFADKAPGKTP
ncbi:MAG: hypothetical protein LBE83_06695, partial [Propionibacteriaceae bacterium]|nr:hypothetical protein [Propionibacteriaceae bacterium]